MYKSRLVLGTAQLGLRYGVANITGQPNKEEAFAILDLALARGINTFDTAGAYGTAEDVLGVWIKERTLAGTVFVISKTKAVDGIEKEIERSLSRLNLTHLDGYLLHASELMHSPEVMAGLRGVKERGLTGAIGVSVYEENDARQAIALGFDYLQVPYNLLDQRLDRSDFFDIARENNVTVFARSPFLQGLLLMALPNIPPHLEEARPYVQAFDDLCQKYQMSRTEGALCFARHSRADHLVLGVETLSQIVECLDAFDMPRRDNGFIEEAMVRFQDVPPRIISPSLWTPKK